MPIENVLSRWRRLQETEEVTAWLRVEGRPGRLTDLPQELRRELREALGRRGISRLYSHQDEAWRWVREGRQVVIVTPTASGKTLCYNLPVLQNLLENPDSRALYLFPTKALSQDQLSDLTSLLGDLPGETGAEIYDGDTPSDRRRQIRQRARIVLTNPDMLHTGILPHHPKWMPFFQNLRYVIVDEVHTYRGVFGSHVGNVLRRLKRVAAFYGSRIQFISCSATIANPEELASELFGEEVVAIRNNGAPSPSREVILYNPPLSNPSLGLRKSALSCARRFAEELLNEGVQTIVFAASRVSVEVLLRYLRQDQSERDAATPRVRGYRGGYLPRMRREIERQLRERELMGVVSTNALELGIDIGSLDACVLAGYPGSIASTWQQIGRAGRRDHSAAILVARNLPLDQFIVRCPDYFFNRSPERALIHPDHLHILVSHVKCALFELPFGPGEDFGREDVQEILAFLDEQGLASRSGDAWHWTDESYPANSVSLRTLGEENFVVFNLEDGNRAIAEVDFDSAAELIHEGAIYLCDGSQFHVDRLDYDGRKAYVRPVQVDYYTDAITQSKLRILDVAEEHAEDAITVGWGEVHLVRKVPGFKKIRFYTGENLGYGEIGLPDLELHTQACWFSFPERELEDLHLSRDDIIRGCLGLSFAIQTVGTLVLMCEARDLGRTVGDRSSAWFALPEAGAAQYSSGQRPAAEGEVEASFDPTIFLFDSVPGGIGFAEQLFRECGEVLVQARRLIERCDCDEGCPSCVGPVSEFSRNTRQAALKVAGLGTMRSLAVQ